MLGARLKRKIKADVGKYWQTQSADQEFVDLAQGKETGHRIADYVDEKTSSYMHAHYAVAYERDRNSGRKPRSMGDFWIKDNGIYHPVNVKTGMSNSGQPNMVALRKILRSILQSQIDSYYLLMIKFAFGKGQLPGVPKVYFVDMLDYIEYLAFDSGPGQIMLKSELFFANIETHKVGERSLVDKANSLFCLLEDGDKRLFQNRKQERDKLSKMLRLYEKNCPVPVSVDSQKEFNLGI